MIEDRPYLLLTPGPLTTTRTVKESMLVDLSTWDDDYNNIVQQVRSRIVQLVTRSKSYTSVLMQGSGTFAVESTIGSVVPPDGKLLIISNGAYGRRIGLIADRLKIDFSEMRCSETTCPDFQRLNQILETDPLVTHVAMVHCETTTGILNPIRELSKIVKKHNRILILDAMSSFGGIPLVIDDIGIDYLISSANKCIQGVPGFAFVICHQKKFEKTRGYARSLSLDLYDQWETMETKGGKWRYTSPTHTLLAFHQALEELENEGGIGTRNKRYSACQRILVDGMSSIGLYPLLDKHLHSPIITAFRYPKEKWFNFSIFYEKLKERQFVIYPGKVSEEDTFRIGTIGDLSIDDIRHLISVIEEVVIGMKSEG
ncbi:2-aminoethylphosphonate--pyruvate transaminase [Candidatus Poribacteria bacterium]|nr:2-aminoethylphosphonate--pyruvate transaminase [Candidatus Poribacteria bacterium]